MSEPKVPTFSIGLLIGALLLAFVSGALLLTVIVSSSLNGVAVDYGRAAMLLGAVLLFSFVVGLTALRKARYS